MMQCRVCAAPLQHNADRCAACGAQHANPNTGATQLLYDLPDLLPLSADELPATDSELTSAWRRALPELERQQQLTTFEHTLARCVLLTEAPKQVIYNGLLRLTTLLDARVEQLALARRDREQAIMRKFPRLVLDDQGAQSAVLPSAGALPARPPTLDGARGEIMQELHQQRALSETELVLAKVGLLVELPDQQTSHQRAHAWAALDAISFHHKLAQFDKQFMTDPSQFAFQEGVQWQIALKSIMGLILCLAFFGQGFIYSLIPDEYLSFLAPTFFAPIYFFGFLLFGFIIFGLPWTLNQRALQVYQRQRALLIAQEHAPRP